MLINKCILFFTFIVIRNVQRTKAQEGLPCGAGNLLAGTCQYIEDCNVDYNERQNLVSCGRYNLYCCPNKPTISRKIAPKKPEFRPPFFDNDPELYPADQPIKESLDGVPCGSYPRMGVCRKIFNCKPAFEQLKRYRKHDYARCGFDKDVEVVCCINKFQNGYPTDTKPTQKPIRKPITQKPTRKPTTQSTQTPTSRPINSSNNRKSVQACLEYTNEITSPAIEFQILGGRKATPGEFPHMAALGFRIEGSDELSWRCGGSLISNRYVLTAAHCVAPQQDKAHPFLVRLGKINILEDGDLLTPNDYLIENFTIHPSYMRVAKINDIALIRLARNVDTNDDIRPACLYTKPDEPETMIITGWGSKTPREEAIQPLQKADVKLVSRNTCNEIYTRGPWPRPVHENSICAHADGLADACRGDSGGPLQVHGNTEMYSIVGITSIGQGCGGTTPGIYTKVYNFLDWIENIVW